jgi:hypothetical protein
VRASLAKALKKYFSVCKKYSPYPLFETSLAVRGQHPMNEFTRYTQIPVEEVKRITGIGFNGRPISENSRDGARSEKTSRMHIFDIFRMQTDGESLWLDTAASLEEGQARISELQTMNPGSYFLFNQKTQEKIFLNANKS